MTKKTKRYAAIVVLVFAAIGIMDCCSTYGAKVYHKVRHAYQDVVDTVNE